MTLYIRKPSLVNLGIVSMEGVFHRLITSGKWKSKSTGNVSFISAYDFSNFI